MNNGYQFVRVNPGQFNIKENFWTLNPQHQYISPFRELYLADSGQKKEWSSRLMWCVWLWCDPNYENKIFRQTLDRKLQSIRYYEPSFDPDQEVIKECIDAYPTCCLTKAARAFVNEEDTLEDRVAFLRMTKYDLTNASDLDKIRANTPKIYEMYRKVREMFELEEGKAKVYGGREETIREKGDLLLDVKEEYEE